MSYLCTFESNGIRKIVVKGWNGSIKLRRALLFRTDITIATSANVTPSIVTDGREIRVSFGSSTSRHGDIVQSGHSKSGNVVNVIGSGNVVTGDGNSVVTNDSRNGRRRLIVTMPRDSKIEVIQE